MENRSGRRVLAEGRHLQFVEEDGWEYVDRAAVSGIAVVVAVTGERRLLLVEQYRPPVRKRVIELPAGLAGDRPDCEGEDTLAAARRELLEETGYRAGHWEELFSGPPSVGVTSEVVTFFLATGLRRTGAGGGEEGERITLHEVPLGAAVGWLDDRNREGLLIDPKVYAGLFWALRSNAGLRD